MKKSLLSFLFASISFFTFSQITLTSTVSNVSCFGGSNGSATVSASGGSAPYTYTWMPSNMNTPTLSGLAAGAYTVTVMDALANTSSLVVIIGEPSQLVAVTSVTNANCGQANGAICVNATGGMGAFSFFWSNGANTSCINLIQGGAYTYTVIDLNSCVVSSSVIVNSIGGPSVSVSSQTNISCFGGCNGIASTSVSGTPPYIYNWSNGQVSASATNLCAGLYTVSVTDNAGCVGSTTVNITQPTQLNAVASSTGASCFGACNGSANIIASGGTGAYTYSWNTAPPQNTPFVTNLCPAMMQCTITDANGCTLTRTVVITQPPPMNISISHTNASCGGTCDGSANAMITGGNAPYTFQWIPSGGNGIFAQNLCAGNYIFQATDNNGCVGTGSVNILSNGSSSLPNATITSTRYNETCLQTGDGSIDLSITGTNPGPFTYLWSNGATTQDITNVPSNTYWVNITDGSSNCMTLTDTVNSIGSNCGTVTGNIFIDNNSDCIKNTGDNNYNSAGVIINPGNRLGYTNSNGDYSINNLPYGTYSVSINNILPNVYPSCTTTLTSTVNAGSPNSSNNNLSVAFNSVVQPDLQVSAWNGGIVPGFVCRMNYNLSNLNQINGTGLYKVILPPAFIPNITNASPNTYTVSGDTIIWNFSNVTFSSNLITFYVDFTVPLSTPLGSTFTSCIFAQPNTTDLNYANNTYCYARMVTGSYDPNDKTPNPIGIGSTGDIAASVTDLTYLIRFQNTGNGPAVNIMVSDTLSSNVNLNTFEMLGASHNYNIDILPGNVLRWKFNNIMLVDSGTNEPASHGYIQYRIKRTANNTPGTQIKNTANIYFDFNAPVITNTAINTIETITGIHAQSINDNGWNVYPNPSNGVLYLVNSSMLKESGQIQVLNAIGQTVFEESMNGNYKNIDLSKLNNGIYFVKISSDKQSVIKRVVLSK